MKFYSLALLLLLSGGMVHSAHADVRDWYVATNGNDVAGTDWNSAYTNLQWVLGNAGNGDTIYLAGQAFPLTTQLVWTATDGVTISGGYAATNSADTPGLSDPDQWPTVLTRANPAVNHRIFQIQNVTNGTLQAVTVTGGRLVASGSSGGGGCASRIARTSGWWIASLITTRFKTPAWPAGQSMATDSIWQTAW